MKTMVRRLGSTVLVVILAAVIGLAFFGGSMIRNMVNRAGPTMLGVPVTLKDAKISLVQGHVRLAGLHIGNPEGFKTGSLFDVGSIEVKLKTSSLLSDTIVIEKILVDAPEITFERGLRQSNFGALIENLGARSGDQPSPQPAPEASPGPAAKPGRKVVIDELTVSGGRVKLSVTAAMGFSAPVALSTISMRDIGRDSGARGMGVADVIRLVLGTVFKSVVEAAGGIGEVGIDGVRAVGGAAMGGVSAAGGAALQGASAIGGAAAGQVRNLGGGVGRALGGLLGGGATTNGPAAP